MDKEAFEKIEENIAANVDLIMKLQEEEMKSSPLASLESERSEILRQIDNVKILL